jgi:hypothetical protein
MAKRFSQQTKEKARTLRAAGMTYVAIAEELGCTPPCVRYWCDARARAENQQRMSVNGKERSRKMPIVAEDEDIVIGLYDFVNQWNDLHGTDFEVDHIIPCHAGGEHSIKNLRILPRSLNRTGRPRN